jgi:hypothetical protein
VQRGCAALALAVALVGGAACSTSSTTAAATTVPTGPASQYCTAWSDLVTAFGAYDQIDVVNGGLDSVRTYIDDVEAAATSLASASDSLLQPKVEAFNTSLQDLVTTLTSPDLPVNRTQQVRDAKAEVDAAWNDLVTTITTTCPDVKASTV